MHALPMHSCVQTDECNKQNTTQRTTVQDERNRVRIVKYDAENFDKMKNKTGETANG